jgi:hypothetical protein
VIPVVEFPVSSLTLRRSFLESVLMIASRALVAVAALACWSVTAHAAAPKAAVFPFELIDTSEEGELNGQRADESRRLEMLTTELRKRIAESGAYRVVDLSPQAAEIEKDAPIYKCNGCEIGISKAAGADLAVVCTVQKVSNLILNINIYVKNVNTEVMEKVMSADIRGNTDESWMRGLSWLVRNRLLASDEPRKG